MSDTKEIAELREMVRQNQARLAEESECYDCPSCRREAYTDGYAQGLKDSNRLAVYARGYQSAVEDMKKGALRICPPPDHGEY